MPATSITGLKFQASEMQRVRQSFGTCDDHPVWTRSSSAPGLQLSPGFGGQEEERSISPGEMQSLPQLQHAPCLIRRNDMKMNRINWLSGIVINLCYLNKSHQRAAITPVSDKYWLRRGFPACSLSCAPSLTLFHDWNQEGAAHITVSKEVRII